MSKRRINKAEYFRLDCMMEPDWGDISGVFPVKQRKMVHFHAFQLNRRNFSVYLGFFSCFFLNKRNFSAYFSSLFAGDYRIFRNRLIVAYIGIKNAWSI